MLESLKTILSAAREGHYAVGAFNCLSVEHARGAVRAAEEEKSPIILQLAEVQFPCAPIELMAPVYLELARQAEVPVCVHLDHGQSFETCARAIKLGFNSVMFDGASLPFEENARVTSEVVRMAKAVGVDVEAELGRVGDAGTDEGKDLKDAFTDVGQAGLFVERTGCDALAISIGNLHGRYIATPKLNITRLKELKEALSTPLVLHGGSGTSREDFKSCIHNGICKVNVATTLQLAVMDAVKEYVSSGNTSYIDMKGVIESATEKQVRLFIDLFESSGKV
ncbi:MAG: class II fructose-bisphosphate aldolase [Bacteroidales bacterium]|nr:class II fructose-bisphosphate aldolase [Bacteroidales bacterium]